MFSIEHEFDATIITLVDEDPGDGPLTEDVTVSAFEECITLTQLDPRTETPVQITLSMTQVYDLVTALNLPEGVYRRE